MVIRIGCQAPLLGEMRQRFQEAEKRAKRMGAVRIDLVVWNFNTLAISAYEDYGMTPQRCIYEKLL